MNRPVDECPLCLNNNTQDYARDKLRHFSECLCCGLIFVPRTQLINSADEKKRYDSHQNDEGDEYYRKYLNVIAESILPTLSEGEVGLDFGCGRTTLMSDLFKKKNFSVDSYDLYYFPDMTIWSKKFNFIILSEVIEHLRDPIKEMKRIRDLLLPDGKIFIKTKLHPGDKTLFENWFYKRDITHIQFFSDESLGYLAKELSMLGPKQLSEDLFVFTATSM